MKTILLTLCILIATGVFAACGPAVGRATGDTPNTDATNVLKADDVATKLTDLKKEQDDQLIAAKTELRTDLKEAQSLFSQQEEEFHKLKNTIDVLETGLSRLKSAPEFDRYQSEIEDLKALVGQNSDLIVSDNEKEFDALHSRIDSLEEVTKEVTGDLQSILMRLEARDDEFQNSVSELSAVIEESIKEIPTIYAQIEDLKEDIQSQLDFISNETNNLGYILEQLDADMDASLTEMASEINDPEYPISVEQNLGWIKAEEMGFKFHTIPNDYSNVKLVGNNSSMTLPNCEGPYGMRECIDTVVGEINVYQSQPPLDPYTPSGFHSSMGATVDDICTVTEALFGIFVIHGRFLPDGGGNTDLLYLTANKFMTAEEYDILGWASHNIDIFQQAALVDPC